MYPFYEKIARTGIRNVCIHKGLFAPAVEASFPGCGPMPTCPISAAPPRTGRS